ncbi:MAG: hypothetical protein H6974_06230 [Gammaproteobacteria bacterium]|nr:hypothetical protein [Gammaproteobacteria bacterium]MCP5196366.1 hypothetical protein [Gammaproteobacteria bacterium]
MNIRPLSVLIASTIILVFSMLLSYQVFEHADEFISELLSLYAIGAMVGCGLAVAWLMGEFIGQD